MSLGDSLVIWSEVSGETFSTNLLSHSMHHQICRPLNEAVMVHQCKSINRKYYLATEQGLLIKSRLFCTSYLIYSMSILTKSRLPWHLKEFTWLVVNARGKEIVNWWYDNNILGHLNGRYVGYRENGAQPNGTKGANNNRKILMG